MEIHPRVTQISTHFDGIAVELYFIKGKRNAIIDTGTTQSPKEGRLPCFTEGPMIPIAIVTKNRHQYLDITLRSLSATTLPNDQAIIVYDDASDDKDTIKYLYSNDDV